MHGTEYFVDRAACHEPNARLATLQLCGADESLSQICASTACRSLEETLLSKSRAQPSDNNIHPGRTSQ